MLNLLICHFYKTDEVYYFYVYIFFMSIESTFNGFMSEFNFTDIVSCCIFKDLESSNNRIYVLHICNNGEQLYL